MIFSSVGWIKQITNTCRNHFSRSYENRSNLRKQRTFSHGTFVFHTKCSLRSVVVRVGRATTKPSRYAGYTKWRPRKDGKFHTDDASLPRFGLLFWLVEANILRARLIKSTSQNWVVTCHQHWISEVVTQTSFRGKTSGSVAKCRLFSQAMSYATLLLRKVSCQIWRKTVNEKLFYSSPCNIQRAACNTLSRRSLLSRLAVQQN